ncbi:hypothetical protein ACJX0J_029444, partial [Zea mays]
RGRCTFLSYSCTAEFNFIKKHISPTWCQLTHTKLGPENVRTAGEAGGRIRSRLKQANGLLICFREHTRMGSENLELDHNTPVVKGKLVMFSLPLVYSYESCGNGGINLLDLWHFSFGDQFSLVFGVLNFREIFACITILRYFQQFVNLESTQHDVYLLGSQLTRQTIYLFVIFITKIRLNDSGMEQSVLIHEMRRSFPSLCLTTTGGEEGGNAS